MRSSMCEIISITMLSALASGVASGVVNSLLCLLSEYYYRQQVTSTYSCQLRRLSRV